MTGPAPVNKVSPDIGNVTSLLLQWSDGDQSALERLTPIIWTANIASVRCSRTIWFTSVI